VGLGLGQRASLTLAAAPASTLLLVLLPRPAVSLALRNMYNCGRAAFLWGCIRKEGPTWLGLGHVVLALMRALVSAQGWIVHYGLRLGRGFASVKLSSARSRRAGSPEWGLRAGFWRDVAAPGGAIRAEAAEAAALAAARTSSAAAAVLAAAQAEASMGLWGHAARNVARHVSNLVLLHAQGLSRGWVNAGRFGLECRK
jgi:hypothetical protein